MCCRPFLLCTGKVRETEQRRFPAPAALPAEHRLAPPRHPQTNGMVERFNGRINELLQQTRFDCRADLETALRATPIHASGRWRLWILQSSCLVYFRYPARRGSQGADCPGYAATVCRWDKDAIKSANRSPWIITCLRSNSSAFWASPSTIARTTSSCSA